MKKSILLFFALLFSWNIFAYTSLDKQNPIQFLGNKIIYNNEEIILSENNIFLDGNLSDAEINGKPFVFNDFAKAIKALSETNDKKTIHIAPFVYWIDNPDDTAIRVPDPDDTKKYGRARPYGMTIENHHLHLRGLTENPENVVLASNRGQTQGADGNFTMFHFLGDDLKVSNLTMGNYCNVDLEFPLKPELNRPKRNAAIVQAQIAICEGDRIWAENVRFISRLNLNPLSTWKRSFFHKCYFESTDDALAPTGVYLGCVFKFFSSKPFAQTRGAGAVILDSDIYIVGNRKTQYMVKRNSPLALVDVRFHADNDSVKIGWIQDSDFDAEHFYYQYNVRLNGKPVILNGNTVDMTDKSILEVYNIKNFAWDWNPPVLSIEKIENNIIETEKDSLTLKTNIKDITWSVGAKDAGFVKLIEKENIVEIIPTNHTDEPREVIIYAETGNGLKAAKKITVKPPTLPAPTFIGEPKIIRKGNELILDYELNLNGKKDQSYIEWSEYDKEWDRWIGTVPISISRNNIPQKTYHLTKGNAGRLIVAQITTKSNRSEKGEIRTVEQFISKKDKSNLSENINTNFRNFPEWNIPKVPFDPPRKGTWTIEEYRPEGEFTADGRGEKSFAPTSPWSYGFGFDGAAKAEGLYQTRRGARLVYTPVEDSYGDMSLTTTLAPCKSAGQGFGSATGQYLEIYIKYDTQTMTGYGLRIVRTPDNDRSVDFVLMEYKNGIATPISEAVTTSVYRTNCTVNLSVKDDILTATATTDAVYTDERPNIAKEVHLQAKISPDKFGGIGFQHTGTGNTNATVITHLKVDFGK